MNHRLLAAVTLLAGLAAACTSNGPSGQPAGVTLSPLVLTPTSTAPSGTSSGSPAPDSSLAPDGTVSGAPSDPASKSPRPSSGGAVGGFFRDDFNGPEIDQERWAALELDGVMMIRNGRLWMVGGATMNYPRLVSRVEVLPASGPRFLQLEYEFLSVGQPPSFCLDYLPAVDEKEIGAEKPYFWTKGFYSSLELRASPFEIPAMGPEGSGEPGKPHVFRVEIDAANTYRFIVDDREILVQKGPARAPRNFWIGNLIHKPGDGIVMARMAIDKFETGVLTTPAVATPLSTPTPAPTPTPAEDAPASAAPSAEASPEATSTVEP